MTWHVWGTIQRDLSPHCPWQSHLDSCGHVHGTLLEKISNEQMNVRRALRGKIWGALVVPGEKDSCFRDCYDVGCHGKSWGRKALRAT